VSGDTVTPGKPRRNSQASGGGCASDAGVLFVDHAAADPDRVREPARALEAAALVLGPPAVGRFEGAHGEFTIVDETRVGNAPPVALAR